MVRLFFYYKKLVCLKLIYSILPNPWQLTLKILAKHRRLSMKRGKN